MKHKRYSFTVPPTREVGSYKGTCGGSKFAGPHCMTYRQDALSDYNSARAHDGLNPVKRMPAGTTYKAIKE